MVAARENLGPAERIINTLVTHQDHLYHGRPGIVFTPTFMPANAAGIPSWAFVTHKVEGDQKVVYKLEKVGKKTVRTKLGVMVTNDAGKVNVLDATRVVGEYREPGLFTEVVEWMYRQIGGVWALDNEFAARWASYAYTQEHRDFKTVIAAFMLVQTRKGDPVKDAGKVAFYDDDYRDIGEAMMLSHSKKDKYALTPKQLLRIHEVLTLPAIAQINRDLGFTASLKTPFLGRWPKVVEKWLRNREDNPKLLDILVKEGWRSTVITLAQLIGYKPTSPRFFQVLRWKQRQATDGRRTMLDVEVDAATSWAALNEEQICQTIIKEHPSWKRVVGLLPPTIGTTRAIVAASIQAGSMSDKDLVIMTPTLEELGLLEVDSVKKRWEAAIKAATDTRAANVARNVRSEALKEKLQEASDIAVQKAVAEVTKGLRIYFIIDISASMQGAIERAMQYIAKFLQGFPLAQLHVSVFNTAGREITIKTDKTGKPSAATVEHAFKGIVASGGTAYGEGVRVLAGHVPAADEDTLMIFVGDEEAPAFTQHVRASGLNPMAFGLLKVVANQGAAGWRAQQYAHLDNNRAVRDTAAQLGIPCFMIDEATFDDAYAIPRTVRALVAATPVGAAVVAAPPKIRVSIIDTILKTDLLQKPAWA